MSEADEGQYHLQLNPAAWTIIRLDGRNFSARSNAYRRPFDPEFHAAMRKVAETLMAETPAVAAHTASDEISLVFAPGTDWFSNRFDKWISTCASVTGAALARHLTRINGVPSADARAIALPDIESVQMYLAERLRNSRRNCRNAYIYFPLIAAGMSPRAADARARELAHSSENFIPPAAPDWELYGAILRYLIVSHTGLDPRTDTPVETTRRRLVWAELAGRESLPQVVDQITAYIASLGGANRPV
jgi:tRNA(His) 5'-end guanylyltransferase